MYVCKDLRSKLQRAVGAARKEMPHGEEGAAFPKVLTIGIAGCSVEATTRAPIGISMKRIAGAAKVRKG